MRSLRRILLCVLLVALHTLIAWPAPSPVPAHAANPTLFANTFDSQSAGALTTGGTPNLFTAITGGSNLSVQTATYNSGPNALSVNVVGGGSSYAEKDYATRYWQHELTWRLYLGSDFTIASGSYLVLAKLLPSPSTSVGKVNVTLSDTNVIRIDYVDSTGTQRYLYGNSVSKGAWHTIDISETIGMGSGAATLTVDGTTNASGTNLDLGSIGVGSFMIGAEYSPPNAGTSGHLYVDDVTATGSDARPILFTNTFDSQSAGALTTGGAPNLFTATTGGSNLSVQTATSNSSPNALSVNVAGGGSYYAEKDYSAHYWQHELTWHLYLGADFTIASGSYLVLAKLLPSPSTSVGKVNVVLSDTNVIRIDYVDSTGTQRYLYGNSVSKGAWHTIDVWESIATGAVTLKVDGTTNASGSNLDLGSIGVGSVMIGAQYSPPNAGTTGHLYVDDVTATGTDASPILFANTFDSQSAGALTAGSDANLFTSTTGGSNLSVQTATANSSPNALSVNVGGGGSFYAEKDYATRYWQHELSWRLYLGSDFTIASGSYLVLAQLLPSASTSVGKVNVTLSDSNTIRIDYVDSAGTQHYLYGNPVSKGAWHTIDVSETVGAGSGAVTLKVDGTTNASGTTLDLGRTGVGSVMIGDEYSPPNAGTTSHLYVDDVSTTGTSVQSGQVPWHAHKTVRLSAGLSASVDLADGHVDLAADDLSVPARGPALALGHVWDSTLAQAGAAGSAGQGWQTSLAPSMGGGLTSTVSYTDTTGAVWLFPYTGAPTAPPPYTTYQTPAGLPWALSTSTAGYTLTNVLSGETLAFDAQGRSLSDSDAYGNQNVLSYGASGPISDTNSGGRVLSLAYSNGLLSDVQSPLWRSSGGAQGQHVTYGYNGSGQLTTLTRGAGTTDALTATFGYSGTQLISVTTPYTQATRTWTLSYDDAGRLVSITSPVSGTLGQAGYTPAYTTLLSYNGGTTQVVDGAGTSGALTTTDTLDGAGEATQVTDGLGNTGSATYDADHDVLTSTDANGNTTTNSYQYVGPNGSTGLITQTVQPKIQAYSPLNGTLDSPTTRHTYNASNDLIETDLPEGGTELFGYDTHHGVITTTQTTANATTWRGSVNQLDAFGDLTGVVDGASMVARLTTAQQRRLCAAAPAPCAAGLRTPASQPACRPRLRRRRGDGRTVRCGLQPDRTRVALPGCAIRSRDP